MDFSLINLTLKKDKTLDDMLSKYSISLQAFNYFYSNKLIDNVTYYTLKNDTRILIGLEDVNSDKKFLTPAFDLVDEIKNKDPKYGLMSIRDWSANGLKEIKQKLKDSEADEGNFYLNSVVQYDQIVSTIKATYSEYFNLGVVKNQPLKDRYKNASKYKVGYVSKLGRQLGGKGSGRFPKGSKNPAGKKDPPAAASGAETKQQDVEAVAGNTVKDAKNYEELKQKAKTLLGINLDENTDLNAIINTTLDAVGNLLKEESNSNFYSKVTQQYKDNVNKLQERLELLKQLTKYKYKKAIVPKLKNDLTPASNDLKGFQNTLIGIEKLKKSQNQKLPALPDPKQDFTRNDQQYAKIKSDIEEDIQQLESELEEYALENNLNVADNSNQYINALNQQLLKLGSYIQQVNNVLGKQQQAARNAPIQQPGSIAATAGSFETASAFSSGGSSSGSSASSSEFTDAGTVIDNTQNRAAVGSGIVSELRNYLKRYQELPFYSKTDEANTLQQDLQDALATDRTGKFIRPDKINQEELRKHINYFAKNIGIAGKSKDQIKSNQEKEQAKDMIDQAVKDAKEQDKREKEEEKDVKLSELRPDINEGKDLYEGIDKGEKQLNNQSQFLKNQVKIKDEEIKLLKQKLDQKKNQDFNNQLSGIAPVFRNFLNIQIGDVFQEDYTDYVDSIF